MMVLGPLVSCEATRGPSARAARPQALPSGSARRGRPSGSALAFALRGCLSSGSSHSNAGSSLLKILHSVTSANVLFPNQATLTGLVGGVRAQVLGDTVQPATPSLPVAALTHPPVPPLRGPGCQLGRGWRPPDGSEPCSSRLPCSRACPAHTSSHSRFPWPAGPSVPGGAGLGPAAPTLGPRFVHNDVKSGLAHAP